MKAREEKAHEKFHSRKKRGRSTALAVCRKRHLRHAEIAALQSVPQQTHQGQRQKKARRTRAFARATWWSFTSTMNFFSAAPPTARPLPYKKRPPLRMVYEDENIAALYKPAHLLCHSDRTGDVSLVELFTDYLAQKGEYDAAAEAAFSPALCNRIDRGTEGPRSGRQKLRRAAGYERAHPARPPSKGILLHHRRRAAQGPPHSLSASL